MTTTLPLPANYRAAHRALAKCRRVDEVKSIRDKAAAMQVYAQQAKDRTLIECATDIRLRAEIRAGELLREMAERKERRKGGDPKSQPATLAKLSDLGISKTQSSRWQQLAALTKEDQEAKIEKAKRKAEAAVNVRTAGEPRKSTPDPVDRCLKAIRAAVVTAMKAAPPEKLFGAIRGEIDVLAAALGVEFGATSAAEAARKDARIEELERMVRQRDLALDGLRRENAEARA